MEFEKKVPEWAAQGTEPPASLKSTGFQAGQKPPAAYFNWFWNAVSACLTELQAKLGFVQRNAALPIAEAVSTDGISYTATVEGVTELYNGLTITVIPNMNSASNAITLNVNGLGAKMVRVPLSFNNAAMTTPRLDTYYSEGRPLTLQYDAAYLAGDGIWKTVGKGRTSAQDLYGTVPIESGGTDATTAAEAREKLGITPANIGAVSMRTATASLSASGWSSKTQTVSVSGVTENNVVIVTPASGSHTEYNGCAVRCTAQASGKLTFTCTNVPTSALTANVLILT